ncbi:MAG: hypothetical protein IJ055_04370 [Oscillospiraceae bacterium]|nr:hypothetical protein [Oscillospiraceae bacterium]
MKMTSKELLYLEDALGHEQYFLTKCREVTAQLQDPALRQCLEQMTHQHQQLYTSLHRMLG